jgi:hypothetical protein
LAVPDVFAIANAAMDGNSNSAIAKALSLEQTAAPRRGSSAPKNLLEVTSDATLTLSGGTIGAEQSWKP